MILIISSDDDISTDKTIDWLFYYNIPFIRVSEKIPITNVDCIISNNETDLQITFEINGKPKTIEYSKILVYENFINI